MVLAKKSVSVERFFLTYFSINSKILTKEESNMREFSEEEAKIVLELVKEAETGNAMKIQDFFAEIEEEERRRKQYRKNMKLGLSH